MTAQVLVLSSRNSFIVTAALNLLSLYHDTLLTRRIKTDPKLRPLIPPSAHSRFTHAWADKSAGYKWAARMLEILKFLQLLVEMSLRRSGRIGSGVIWRCIVGIEFVKCVHRARTDTAHSYTCLYIFVLQSLP